MEGVVMTSNRPAEATKKRVAIFEQLREYASGGFSPEDIEDEYSDWTDNNGVVTDDEFDDDITDNVDEELHHEIWSSLHQVLHQQRTDVTTSLVEIRVFPVTRPIQHGWCWFPAAIVIDLHSDAPLIHGVELLNPHSTHFEAKTAYDEQQHKLLKSLIEDAQQYVSIDRFLGPREYNTQDIAAFLERNGIEADIPPSTRTTASNAYQRGELHAQFFFDRLSWFPQPVDDISLRDALVTAVEVNAYGITTQVVEQDNDIEISRTHDDFAAFTQWLRLYRRWPGAPETHTL